MTGLAYVLEAMVNGHKLSPVHGVGGANASREHGVESEGVRAVDGRCRTESIISGLLAAIGIDDGACWPTQFVRVEQGDRKGCAWGWSRGGHS